MSEDASVAARGERAEQARRALPAHFREKSPLTDTAGVPWKGRDYSVSPFPEDDGSCPPRLAAALEAHRRGEDPHRTALVSVLAESRLLVPIMAVATEEGTTAHGLTGDNGADMAMVTLSGADGTDALPIFTSTAQLAAWQQQARPVPVVAPQAAQAAVQESCTALLLDPADAEHGPLLLQRSILWAVGQGRTWVPPHQDEEVRRALAEAATQVPAVLALEPEPGPGLTGGHGAEVVLRARLEGGLDEVGIRRTVQGISTALAASTVIAERISALKLALSR